VQQKAGLVAFLLVGIAKDAWCNWPRRLLLHAFLNETLYKSISSLEKQLQKESRKPARAILSTQNLMLLGQPFNQRIADILEACLGSHVSILLASDEILGKAPH
jgi:hypothetical protein